MLGETFERRIFVRKKVYVSTPVHLSLKDNRFGINKSTHLDLSIGASFFPSFFPFLLTKIVTYLETINKEKQPTTKL